MSHFQCSIGLDRWIGSTEAKMSAFFGLMHRLVEAGMAPIIFLDEVDALINRFDHAAQHTASIRSLFLGFLGGPQGPPEGMHILCTTNEAWK